MKFYAGETRMDRENTMFTFVDQKTGKEVGCEYIDSIQYAGREYAVMLLKEEEEGELVFMHAESDRRLVPVRDQETLTALFTVFKDRWSGEFVFED